MPADAQELYERLWREKYAALFAAEAAAESTRRAEAFVDVPRHVAGCLLRPITAYDMLLLDGAESPFVCGDPEAASDDHLALALWRLHAANTGSVFWCEVRRRLFVARCRRRWRDAERRLQDHAELLCYFDDAFADAAFPQAEPADGQAAPDPRTPSTHFLSTLLVAIAAELGPIDPATGAPFIHTPVARLWQYLRDLREREHGRTADHSRSKRLRSECLAEVNTLLHAEREEQAAAVCPLPSAV